MGRERWSCRHCGSSVRFRSVIHALSIELFGKSLAITDFPVRRDIVGIGLSDGDSYGLRLGKKLSYTNTYYHKAPLFDITSIDESQCGQYDFIISSDVFEHVCQPISRAFENACKVLKPGGVMILTVPYTAGKTREHFPDIEKFSVTKQGEEWILDGTTTEGEARTYKDLTFHGGPGTTVEFRLFGEDSLMQESYAAGFEQVRVHEEAVEEFGICWNPYIAEDAPYRPVIYGLDTPPWALAKSLRPDKVT